MQQKRKNQAILSIQEQYEKQEFDFKAYFYKLTYQIAMPDSTPIETEDVQDLELFEPADNSSSDEEVKKKHSNKTQAFKFSNPLSDIDFFERLDLENTKIIERADEVMVNMTNLQQF